MRFCLLFLFCLVTFPGFAQSKSATLQKYFMGLLASEQFENNVSLLKNDPRFGIDSVTTDKRIFSSYQGDTVHAFPYRNIVLMFQKQIWMDTVTKLVHDTICTYTVQYLFNEQEEEEANAFYKQLKKEFRFPAYYGEERKLKGQNNATSFRLTQGKYDTFAEIIFFKGHQKGQLRYVSIRYQKRRYYAAEGPSFSTLSF